MAWICPPSACAGLLIPNAKMLREGHLREVLFMRTLPSGMGWCPYCRIKARLASPDLSYPSASTIANAARRSSLAAGTMILNFPAPRRWEVRIFSVWSTHAAVFCYSNTKHTETHMKSLLKVYGKCVLGKNCTWIWKLLRQIKLLHIQFPMNFLKFPHILKFS